MEDSQHPSQAAAWWVSILYDPGQIDTFKFGGQLVHMHLSGIDVIPKEYATKELSHPQLIDRLAHTNNPGQSVPPPSHKLGRGI